MIKTKADLKEYLLKDKFALGKKKRKCPLPFVDDVWKFEIFLRKHEYYLNTKKNKLLLAYYAFRHYKQGVKLGFSVPCNTCGAGLRINHHGYIVVNHKARIGEFCDIHQGVNIGAGTDGSVPTIGNNVWIGPGAKLYGNIHIADEIMIGANSVVTKTFDTPKITIAGVPAKVLKNQGNTYKRQYVTM